jgi:thiol-disulfide isomerase/thioredoxin/small nuclear ribonucleoprotein (snRNP)-like protein
MNNKTYIPMILLSLLACSQVSNQKKLPKEAVYKQKIGDTVTLIINKKKNIFGTLSYIDKFNNTSILYNSNNPKEEHIVKKLFIDGKDIVWFNKFPFFTPCLIYPRDTIVITYTENNQPPNFHNPKFTVNTNPYNIFTLLSKTKSSIIEFEFTQLLTPKKNHQKITEILQDKYKANLTFIDSISEINKSNMSYYNSVKDVLKYNFICQNIYSKQKTFQNINISNYKALFETENDINLSTYRQALFEIFFYSIDKKLPTLADSLIATYDSVSKMLTKTNIKEYLQFKKQQKLFLTACTDSSFINYLNVEKMITENTKGKNSIISIFNLSKSENLENNFRLDAGKLILIDLWASWCIPCLSEIPNSKKLINNYKNQPIAFYFLSIDENINFWKSASIREGINNYTKNYLLLDFNFSKLKTQFNISSIPRYILIGKDGKVISADAPRPSDPKLKTLIDKYINQ